MKKWNYEGPSTGFKTILKALNYSESITAIGFSTSNRNYAQIDGKKVKYPKGSVSYHLYDDNKIYKSLKNKLFLL